MKVPRRGLGRESGRWADLLRGRSVKFRKAQVRHLVLTVAADRLSGGRLLKRHLAQETVVRKVEVRHPNWPAAFDGLTIAHLSDFHLGRLMPVERAVAIVERVGSLGPDLVACTGDVVDLHHDGVAPVFAAMAACGATHGAFLVLGNHDHLDSDRAIARLAARAGVATLRDEAVSLAETLQDRRRASVATLLWLGSIYEGRGEVDAALVAYGHAAQVDPRDWRGLNELGHLLLRRPGGEEARNVQAAAEAFEAALFRAPLEVAPRLNLALARARQGRTEEARRAASLVTERAASRQSGLKEQAERLLKVLGNAPHRQG